MKLIASINGEERLVEVSASEGREVRLLKQDEEKSADLVETEPGVYSAIVGRQSYEVRLEEYEKGDFGIWVDSHECRVELSDPRRLAARRGTAASSGLLEMKAPMPGKVVRRLVAEGDAVEEDQGVIVIEAMKMQNELRAPKAGVVCELRAAEGDSVAAGETLAVLE